MKKIAVIGMAGNSAFFSVDAFRPVGETVKAASVHFEPGGKGFNQAVAAARGGGEVSFLAAVGKDGAGAIADFLEKEGIRAFLPEKEGQTAFASIVTDKGGANVVTVYQGPSLSPDDVENFRAEIERSDVLLLNNEVPEEVNLLAAKIAKGAGKYVLVNPAPGRGMKQEFLSLTDLFVPNEFEYSFVRDAGNCLVTLGAEGCRFEKTGLRIPAFPAGKAVDTTGAGDTFCGYLALGIACGLPLEKAAEGASKAAGISTTRRFAATAIPTKKEVDEF